MGFQACRAWRPTQLPHGSDTVHTLPPLLSSLHSPALPATTATHTCTHHLGASWVHPVNHSIAPTAALPHPCSLCPSRRSTPKTAALFKYMRAVGQREPHNRQRLIAVRLPLAGWAAAVHLQRESSTCRPAGVLLLPNHAMLLLLDGLPACPSACLQLCTRILSDPDRSDKTAAMKNEVGAEGQ